MITHSHICGIHVKTLSKMYSILGSFGTLLVFAILKLFSLLSLNIFLLILSNFMANIYALNGTIKERPRQLLLAEIFLLPNIGAGLYALHLAKRAMVFHFMLTWVYAVFILAGSVIIYTLVAIFVFHRTKKFFQKEQQRRRE